jgi:hypothetical protein
MLSWFTLWWATSSDFAARAMEQLPLHMVAHIFVMFIVPIGLTYSGAGTKLAKLLFTSGHFPGQRISANKLNHPVLAFVVLNGVMVASHLPPVFNATMQSSWAMDWLMEPAFFACRSLLLFFHCARSRSVARSKTALAIAVGLRNDARDARLGHVDVNLHEDGLVPNDGEHDGYVASISSRFFPAAVSGGNFVGLR